MRHVHTLVMWVFRLKMISVLMAVMIAQVVSFRSQCGGWPDHTLFPAENRVLENFVYDNKTVRSYIICGRDCSKDENCKSFNFFKHTRLCQLNNSTWVENSDDFFAAEGSMYFDSDVKTPLRSLAGSSLAPHQTSCKKLLGAGCLTSDIYTIYPNVSTVGLQVYCDMQTDGGGWIVFQRHRQYDDLIDFNRGWTEYQTGFGDLSEEFWLGNDNLVSLTSNDSQQTWEIQVDLEDSITGNVWAKYSDFQISVLKYTLSFDQYDVNSTAPNLLQSNNHKPFSTKDNDNDGKEFTNCALFNNGGWWYTNNCITSVNKSAGPYFDHSVSKSSMKIREQDF